MQLFQPIRVGKVLLQHRVVLAPLTRNRCTMDGIPLPLVKVHYEQRGSIPGTLLISEATVIHRAAGGFPYVPGIWTEQRMKGWKEVVEAVHVKQSFIFSQIWAIGRAAVPQILAVQGLPYVSASNIPLTGQYVQWFAQAADNAVNVCGFDGVELHSASGYLLQQFIEDTNVRTDEYGGSIETGPDMRMEDPKPTYAYIVTKIKERFPNLAFTGNLTRDDGTSNDFIREIWAPKPLISCGAYTRDTAIEVAQTKDDIIASGRVFIANPDLPKRWKEGLPLNPYDRDRFYCGGDETEVGYTDYPFAEMAQSRL
ncbi:hypothetical protein C8J56DRAFT_1095150 [Mycena floridula]|nr:hypothetical protein C8J56DRAFT_1095150 [Mycena floridula]